ncbi:hypothetical protein BGX31_007571 [Mortierella sp. GBA43]|nr:hypothetical protein BGX31_007571 [Mortierella sp. GBA43]
MATSHITPSAGLRPEQVPLGGPVPSVPHAISVSLPTFQDNVDYEEAKPRVVNAMVSGYPRFFVALKVKEKPDGIRVIKIFATFFPKEAFSVAKQYWQHAGDIVSSRLATFCLRWLALKAEEDQKGAGATLTGVGASGGNGGNGGNGATIRMPRGNRHYASARQANSSIGSNGWGEVVNGVAALQLQQRQHKQDDEDKPVEETDGMDSRDYEVYVEERYGRNLDLSFAPKAKVAMRRRIASQVSHTAGDGEFVTENDVYLYPTGMSAIYNAHQIALALSPTRKSVCFGFPYTDTLKVLEKFGPGCYFYGHGEDQDMEKLEKELLERQSAPDTKEEDKILAVFCEFPSNPLLKSANLVRLGELADKFGFMIVVDETLGNFVNVRILEYADIVVSSLSKIFSGDSNVMGGSLVLNPKGKFYGRLKEVLGRDYEDLMWFEDAIFMERNSRTFQARIARIDENTEALCDYLRAHPKVKEVYYPKYITTNNYLTHKVEGAGYGGLFSVIFHAENGGAQFFDALPFHKGPSLGTNFTLACPYTILAHYYELDWAAQFGISRNLIRVAVGLEDREVLMQGVQEALDAIQDDS